MLQFTSIKKKHLPLQGPYEIQGDTANGEQHQGPRKSRTSLTKLFDKFAFMCVGDCPGLTVGRLLIYEP